MRYAFAHKWVLGLAILLSVAFGVGAETLLRNVAGNYDTDAWGGSTAAPPQKYISGLEVSCASATNVTVAAGTCADSTNASWMTLAAPVTVDISTSGAAASLNTAVLSTTGAIRVDTTIVDFDSSVWTEAQFIATARTLTGTIASTTTTVNGTGTKFLTEVAIGDVIRSAAKGASRVTAIASNAVLTLVAAFPEGDQAAGSGATLYENLTMGVYLAVSPDNRSRISTISHGGTVGVVATAYAAQTSSRPITVGVIVPSCWDGVFLLSGTSGTTAVASTQRTTPYTLTGYAASHRLVGFVPIDAGEELLVQDPDGHGNYTVNTGDILYQGKATAYTRFPWSAGSIPGVPPLATRVLLQVVTYRAAAGHGVYLSTDGVVDTATVFTSQATYLYVPIPAIPRVGGDQSGYYKIETAADSAFGTLTVVGWGWDY